MHDDHRYMRRALELAGLGLGRTSPNPPVGAVVVRDQAIIGEGWHQRAGEAHAEVLALAQAGDAARGADLYCTLEPCCHYGRTPPCTGAIGAAGVRRLVYSVEDPDPRCAGEGAEALQTAGIAVEAGVLRDCARELYEPYLKHKQTGLPFVTLKLAMTLDGKVAAADGSSRWITGKAARQLVHRWRDETDAVMVGIGTVLADDPQLTVRCGNRDERQPLRVVVDTQARTPTRAQVLQAPGHCLIAVGESAPAQAVTALEHTGAEVLRLPEHERHVDLGALLRALGQRDTMSVLVEGGPTLAAALARQRLVDKVQFFYAPKLLGSDGRDGIAELGISTMSEALHLRIDQVRGVGTDILVTAYPCSRD